ncbi:hypothetical protein H7827_10510 [Streptomyces sp. JH002]|jgi:hypothetical protein|uniref:Secreted protein n=1 Tax=Streptomyces xiamenensis TaxID=408015 RepID=A0A0F7FWA0_9ACTN|nr:MULTISPECIES: hypothetical protein [Streptomyces]AKG44877.1 hypothetical protein SXIM_34930 [Streptomyces xiamenensis]MCU4747101.1 hypothetical protein [Streptomyces sp. G-5]QQN77762.1 hypothetical protein IPZ77_10165 [Streptomyces sp. XC 2026]
MKHTTVKTLGAAAVGAALAATGAGSAHALGEELVAGTTGQVVKAVPLGEVAGGLTGNGGNAAAGLQEVTKPLNGTTDANSLLGGQGDVLNQATSGLLGGLPAGALKGGLLG